VNTHEKEIQAMLRRASVFALVGIMLAAAPAAERFDAEASGSCATTQTSGTLATIFSTCVTDTGNVRKFETLDGLFDNFAAPNSGDSYTICDKETGGPGLSRAWSRWGVEEANFSYPTTHTAQTNVRKTADGRYTLTQSFVRDAAEKQLIVSMTLRNNGPGPVTSVWIQRSADINAGGTTSSDVFLASRDSIAALNVVGQPTGMVMTVLTPEVTHATRVMPYSDFDPYRVQDCSLYSPHPVANPSPQGDYVGTILFNLGDLAAGQAKTVKIVYRGL
jgi:hypothetical protein